jgi:flavin-dependent dehydrogenase
MVFSISLASSHMEEVVIIGGGIAGLSCLNAFLDKQISPLLLEGGIIGTPKMCGEFLAPHTAMQLKSWGVHSAESIPRAIFYAAQRQYELHFPEPAGAISRSEVELQLADFARQRGGQIRENEKILETIAATDSSGFVFRLQSGEIIHARTAIFATGNFQRTLTHMATQTYIGIKLHIPKIITANTLQMYSLPNAYLGMIPISKTVSNCACLIKQTLADKTISGKEVFYNLLNENMDLHNIFAEVDFTQSSWLQGNAPMFGRRKIHKWPHAYWIGDAIAGLYPAIGSGFAHGVSSAMLAVECYLQNSPKKYFKQCEKQLKSKLRLGKIMHHLLLNPTIASLIIPFVKANPWSAQLLLHKLDYK